MLRPKGRFRFTYGKKKTTLKADKPIKASQAKPVTAKQPKPKHVKEKSTKPTPLQKAGKGKVIKARIVKSSNQLVDEPDEEQDQSKSVPEPQGAAEATRPLPVEEGKGKAIAMEEKATQSLLALHRPKRKNAETCTDTDKVISESDIEILNISEEQEEYVDSKVYLDERTIELDEGQAGSDPRKTFESRPPPDDDKMDEDQAGSDLGKIHVALAGPNPEPMHDDFVAAVYLKVHKSLKFLADEQVILEDPPSGTLSSMKNLNDTYTLGDQFFNEKSTKYESRKQNVDAEVVSMVTVPMHQASTSVPSLSTPIINLSPLKLAASPLPKPFTTETTETTTTTLPLPLPIQQQSTTNLELAAHVTALEKKLDLPHKINQTVNEVVKEAVYIDLQAPFTDRFRELYEADIKEILHQRMFESCSYKSLPEHAALYEALEASMERANIDKFLAKKDMSRKRRHDDQDPPPPPPDSDLSKNKRHDSNASRSLLSDDDGNLARANIKQALGREAPSSSSKQQFTPHSEQLVEDVPIPDDVNILDSEDTDTADTLAKSYKDPKENKLLSKTGDMGSFIKWFYKRIGKKKLSKSDLEGPAFKMVRAFPENNISLQFHMEECHRLLTDQVDLVNPKGHQLVPDVSKPLPLGVPLAIVSKPRAVIYRDRNDQKKMLRENEVHKFSDGTLIRVLHKLDHMVKDFRLYHYNPGMKYRIWSEDDKRRSEKLMEVIKRRLKIRRVFRSLESFVGGQFRDVDYRTINRTE
nr:hypothetical protein [Tanacetum cinerariifolium]